MRFTRHVCLILGGLMIASQAFATDTTSTVNTTTTSTVNSTTNNTNTNANTTRAASRPCVILTFFGFRVLGLLDFRVLGF